MRAFSRWMFLVAMVGTGSVTQAQTVVTETQIISLVPIPLADTVKYGIYATLGGGSTPQLYEFDTGGDGFYAAFGGLQATAWGTNYTPTGQPVTNAYDSGDVYTGTAVYTSVSLYSATSSNTPALTPVIQTAGNILVGQTTGITNTKGKDNNWPLPVGSTNGPVQGSFWGDFGLSLKANTNGIMNVIAQLQYTNNIRSGFIVRLGPEGDANPSIQVGLTTNDIASFPIQISMTGKDTNSYFPNTTNSTYSGQILTAMLSMSNSASGLYTNTIGVTLDTGATPKLHDITGDTSSLTNYFNADQSAILTNVLFGLAADQTNGSLAPLISFLTSDTNAIALQFGNDFYINMGATLFHEYDVMYDLESGILGFRPIPEVSQAWLMGGGLLILISFSFVRSLRRRRRSTVLQREPASNL